MKTIILIDGHSLAYRMYFALERTGMRTSSDRFPTWGVYGFFKALFDLLRMEQPDGIAIAFDHGRDTFRSEMFEAYKAHRKSMPDDMSLQMAKIVEGVELLGIPLFQIPNYEADDVIGTLAKQAESQGMRVDILTGDQDAFQIIDEHDHINVLLPTFGGGIKRYTRDLVFEKLGIYPERVIDFKGLKGDTSDNIPGIPGVGDKTAAKLITDYGTLEAVLENADAVSGNKLRQSLIDYKDQAMLSKDLATIRYDAPVTFSEDACLLQIPSVDNFIKFLNQMEFRSLLAQSDSLLRPFVAHLRGEKGLSTPAGNGQLPLAPVADADDEETMVTHEPGHFEVAHTVVCDLDDLKGHLATMRELGCFAIDIETSGLNFLTCTFAGIVLSWSPGFGRGKIATRNPLNLADTPTELDSLVIDLEKMVPIQTIYVPIDHTECPNPLSIDAVLDVLKPLLVDPNIIKLAHNAKFERNVFRQHGIILEGLVFDTMIASYVVNPDRRHGLKMLAHDVLGYNVREITELIGKGKKQVPFTHLAVDDAASYASCDGHLTLELAAHFIPQLTPETASLLYEVELPLVTFLADMEYTGIRLDVGYLGIMGKELETRVNAIEQEIYAMAGEEFNLNSPKQVGEMLFVKLQIPARGMTPTKSGYSTNAKVIESLAPEFPIVQKLLDYRQLHKLKTTYVDSLPTLISRVDERIHTSFNQTVAGTGRLSSSDPNLQNIPIRSDVGRLIRQAFVPPDSGDWSILSADYSQIELRLLAHFSEDPKLIEAFRSGEDIHKATASLVFDVPLPEVTKEMRYRAKAVNFGIIYGQTAFGLSNALKIAPKEAAVFIDKYFETYSKVREYIDQTKAVVRVTGVATTICGRRRDFSEGLGNANKGIREFTERAAFNMPLQGSAADLVKVAMIRTANELIRRGLRSKLLLQVHDELVLEVPAEERDEVRQLVLEAMALGQPLRVPLDIDISIGPTWMEVDE